MIGSFGYEFYGNYSIINAITYEHNQSLTNKVYISLEAVRYSQASFILTCLKRCFFFGGGGRETTISTRNKMLLETKTSNL
jgi:hypothetical protein